MSKAMTRDEILGVKDLDPTAIEVPEWKRTVLVRALTGAERDKIEQIALDSKNKASAMVNYRSRLVSMAVVNEAGESIFTEKDIGELSKKNAGALDRIAMEIHRISGIGADAVGNAEKN